MFIVMFVNAIFCWRQSKPGNLPDISEKSPRTPTSPKTPSEKDDDSFFDDPLPDNSREKEISGYVCFNSNNTLHVCVCVWLTYLHLCELYFDSKFHHSQWHMLLGHACFKKNHSRTFPNIYEIHLCLFSVFKMCISTIEPTFPTAHCVYIFVIYLYAGNSEVKTGKTTSRASHIPVRSPRSDKHRYLWMFKAQYFKSVVVMIENNQAYHKVSASSACKSGEAI